MSPSTKKFYALKLLCSITVFLLQNRFESLFASKHVLLQKAKAMVNGDGRAMEMVMVTISSHCRKKAMVDGQSRPSQAMFLKELKEICAEFFKDCPADARIDRKGSKVHLG